MSFMKPKHLIPLALVFTLVPLYAWTAPPPFIMTDTNVLTSTNELAAPGTNAATITTNNVAETNAAPTSPTSSSTNIIPRLSPPVREVVKMAGSGVGDDVLSAYIQNSSSTFNLTPENIIYLQNIGISAPVLSAMLGHDRTMREQAAQELPA